MWPTKFELVVNLKTANARVRRAGQAPGARRRGDRVKMLSAALHEPGIAESAPWEFRPEPPTDPDVNLAIHPACHRTKAAAFR
jgi:hypothetical protein